MNSKTAKYAVIFRATVAEFTDEYGSTAEKLRTLAFEKYGCRDFVSVKEGNQELAISYWETMQQIKDWKDDPEHRLAQRKGRDEWYESFTVEICEVAKTR